MKYLYIHILVGTLLFLTCQLRAQELRFRLESGTGTFSMSDLKTLNTLNLKSLPFSAKITADFPMFLIWKPAVVYTFPGRFSAGISCGIESTGSRISSVDYSGEYALDNLIGSYSPAAVFEIPVVKKKTEVSLFAETGIEFTKLSVKESITVNSSHSSNLNEFQSTNYFAEPGLRLAWHLPVIDLAVSAGYLIDLHKGDFDYAGAASQFLKISKGRYAKAEWSGFRIGVSASFALPGKLKRNKSVKAEK
jgi:hypothetical protein